MCIYIYTYLRECSRTALNLGSRVFYDNADEGEVKGNDLKKIRNSITRLINLWQYNYNHFIEIFTIFLTLILTSLSLLHCPLISLFVSIFSRNLLTFILHITYNFLTFIFPRHTHIFFLLPVVPLMIWSFFSIFFYKKYTGFQLITMSNIVAE